MDILKQKDLQQLLETSGEWCVSLYMPTHRVGREQQQDPIRFKIWSQGRRKNCSRLASVGPRSRN